MCRYFTIVLLAATILLAGAPSADAQWRTPIPGAGGPPSRSLGLAGTYVNLDTGGFCYVYRLPRGGFLFVDDAAQRVNFVWTGPNQLRSVQQTPDGLRIVTTVSRDQAGRIVLYFVVPGMSEGYWVSAS